MNKTITLVAGALIILMIASCEKLTDWELKASDSFPVADCILTNEMKYQELRLYHSADRLNASPAGISGAIIEVNDGHNRVAFQEDILEPGRYISAVPFRVSAGNNYELIIRLDEITDTAYAAMAGVTPLEAIDIVSYDSLLRLNYQPDLQASMTEVFYDWSFDPEYCEKYGACQASEVYYTLDNIDPGKEFAPDRQIIPFPGGTKIIRRKYSLSAPHQQFIRALLLETEWRGGLFDAEPGNIPTNFHHGVQGWFAACMVLSDTTSFE